MIRKYAGLVVLVAVFCCCSAEKEYIKFTGVVKEVRTVTIDGICACTIFIDVQGQEKTISWVPQSLPTSFLTAPSACLEAVRIQARKCALLNMGDRIIVYRLKSARWCVDDLWKIELKGRADEKQG